MTIPAHLIDKAKKRHCWPSDSLSSVYEYGFQAGASFGYQLKADEDNKLLDEVEQLLIEMDRYLNWNSDDLVGDDLIGDQKRTKSFNAKLKLVEDIQSKLKAHRASI